MDALDVDGGPVRINISLSVPLEWALPLYGYLMPLLVALTTITNSFIILVLSRKHLRTPTNNVLIAMAVTDLLTGWTSVPWFLYYYTLEGYVLDMEWGMEKFWCHAHVYLSDILPSVCHTATIWLTVFLAVQRYVYVCVPNSVYRYCTPRTTNISIATIFVMSFVSVMPEIFGKYRVQVISGNRSHCFHLYYKWVSVVIGKDIFYSTYYWLRVSLHFVPCLLLLIFTCKLGRTIKQAEIRKRSFINIEVPVGLNAPLNHGGGSSSNLGVEFAIRRTSVTPRCSPSMSPGRSLYATNRMLAVICSVFLFLEIPAALVFGLHFLVANSLIGQSPFYYHFLNRALIIRNILIVLMSPIQFAIYCSMSEQFRLTARQLFTSRLLFVAQAQATFHGGKRYSLILVDVDSIETKRSVSSRRSVQSVLHQVFLLLLFFRFLPPVTHNASETFCAAAETKKGNANLCSSRANDNASETVELESYRRSPSSNCGDREKEKEDTNGRRKVGRQVSFPDEEQRV